MINCYEEGGRHEDCPDLVPRFLGMLWGGRDRFGEILKAPWRIGHISQTKIYSSPDTTSESLGKQKLCYRIYSHKTGPFSGPGPTFPPKKGEGSNCVAENDPPPILHRETDDASPSRNHGNCIHGFRLTPRRWVQERHCVLLSGGRGGGCLERASGGWTS
ncbi:hypothetical protein NPIL_28261 [Nephila pilipes]|uniref:Uncharacterized protein n=1 Tax=Nephila pilipes TaxID=299642 RepID=A0A8X6NXW8_NEPPI|nr:hypothetical protein NPIL_28261 [Nephila pilipes]